MKISFSTLGCPEWSWDEMVSTAKDLGFDGVEVRGIENELYAPKAKIFSEANIEATKVRLKSLNLEIPCLTSSCYLFDKNDNGFYVKEGKDYIDLAAQLGVRYVRVLGDKDPKPGSDIDFDFTIENLKKLVEYAEGKGVTVILETNGIFADSSLVQKAVEMVASNNVGILWDIHHPFRYMNEPVDVTYEKLKKYIMFVHLKDSVIISGETKYKMMGHGDIPVNKALMLLKENNYDGFVSLEWVKRWCPDLEEPGIVFSHFANYIKGLI
ncbi:MAG TPA: sugar phosphate isomerase/epimerase family protein [Pseudobacteroides sp.]|uniref:sugar phosphate isomerase/epimerase family protein n=1 Tax=Pseudobacteroides sp. TaxID=1968840 RepID=UPI002F94D1B0